MNTVEEIKKTIEALEGSQEYLQLGDVNQLIYPLQKLNDEEWETLNSLIHDWTDSERIVLVNAILEIGDNKQSHYDSSEIIAASFIIAERKNAEILIEKLEFLNNGTPKDVEMINQVFEKIKWIESNSPHHSIDFEKKYNLVNQLYMDGMAMKDSVHSKSNISFIVKKDTSDNKGKIVHNKNSRRHRAKLDRDQYEETIILWRLSKFMGLEEYNGFDFTYIFSNPQLPNGLAYQPFLTLLNSETVFEDYIPNENDSLKIWLEYVYPEKNKRYRPYLGAYLSFIYTHEWAFTDGLDHIHYEYETLYEGEIKIS